MTVIDDEANLDVSQRNRTYCGEYLSNPLSPASPLVVFYCLSGVLVRSNLEVPDLGASWIFGIRELAFYLAVDDPSS